MPDLPQYPNFEFCSSQTREDGQMIVNKTTDGIILGFELDNRGGFFEDISLWLTDTYGQ